MLLRQYLRLRRLSHGRMPSGDTDALPVAAQQLHGRSVRELEQRPAELRHLRTPVRGGRGLRVGLVLLSACGRRVQRSVRISGDGCVELRLLRPCVLSRPGVLWRRVHDRVPIGRHGVPPRRNVVSDVRRSQNGHEQLRRVRARMPTWLRVCWWQLRLRLRRTDDVVRRRVCEPDDRSQQLRGVRPRLLSLRRLRGRLVRRLVRRRNSPLLWGLCCEHERAFVRMLLYAMPDAAEHDPDVRRNVVRFHVPRRLGRLRRRCIQRLRDRPGFADELWCVWSVVRWIDSVVRELRGNHCLRKRLLRGHDSLRQCLRRSGNRSEPLRRVCNRVRARPGLSERGLQLRINGRELRRHLYQPFDRPDELRIVWPLLPDRRGLHLGIVPVPRGRHGLPDERDSRLHVGVHQSID